MADSVRAVVVGGGVIGCAVLDELTSRGIEAILAEAEQDVGEGTSQAGSGIVHTGFDSKPGTAESRLLRRAAELWPATVDRLGVPFRRIGALMLARTEDERARLTSEIAANVADLGVRTELVDRDELSVLAPYVTDEAVAALSIPDEAVVDPFWLTRAFADSALAGGAWTLFGRAVVGLELLEAAVRVRLDDGTELLVDEVFDCAGVHADDVARLAGDDSFAITPRKGQFLLSEESFGIDRIVLPIPGLVGTGMLVTPIVAGGLLLGPTAVDGDDKTDRSVDPADRALILDACGSLVPAVAGLKPIRQFAGLRHTSSTGDFVVRPSSVGDRLFLVAGTGSRGISASPAVAEAVVAEAAALRGWRPAEPRRWFAPPDLQFPDDPGELVCLCRGIGRAEIEAACRRPTAPSTIDAIGRRTGATSGACQGALCVPAVAGIVAAERGIERTAVARNREDSWLFSGEILPTTPDEAPSDAAPDHADIVVVGAGLAGVGAVLAALERGLRPVLLERRTDLGGAFRAAPTALDADERDALARFRAARLTDQVDVRLGMTASGVVGQDDGPGWLVFARSAGGAHELHTPVVVVATGGFVEPVEHTLVAGPRPPGIVTADFVHEALDAGLIPGRRALVVGRGRYTQATVDRMTGVGMEIVEVVGAAADDRPVDEVRGDSRLDAVRIGDEWILCDTLVLCHQLLPQPFLLRGLGLIDRRAGVPAPAGENGALAAAGLWATGTCVRADLDHRRSVTDGLSVGGAAAAAVWAAT